MYNITKGKERVRISALSTGNAQAIERSDAIVCMIAPVNDRIGTKRSKTFLFQFLYSGQTDENPAAYKLGNLLNGRHHTG
jgi:hypothetical protein